MEIVEYNQTAAALAELSQRYSGVVYDVVTRDGMEAARTARAELRKLRTNLEETRKRIKEPALRQCNLIDSEAKRITSEIAALENPIDDQIKKEERRKEEEREAKARAERERIEAEIAEKRLEEAERIAAERADIERRETALRQAEAESAARIAKAEQEARAKIEEENRIATAARREAERIEREAREKVEAVARREAAEKAEPARLSAVTEISPLGLAFREQERDDVLRWYEDLVAFVVHYKSVPQFSNLCCFIEDFLEENKDAFVK